MLTIKNKKSLNYKLILIVFMLISISLLLSPPSYYVIKPGEVNSTMAFIEKHNEVVHKEESFYYTTVLLSEASWYEIALSSFQPHQALVSKRQLLSGRSLDAFIARSELTMKQSQRTAMEAAYTYLSIPYYKEAKELYVTFNNDKRSLFFDADQIKAVVINKEEMAITDTAQLLSIINNSAKWDDEYYTLIVEAKGQLRHIEVERPDEARLPLTVEELASDYKLSAFAELEEVIAHEASQRLRIANQPIGGPSAGLVMALTFIEALQDDVIEATYDIAATGTIQADGHIGIVGSIQQKVVAVDEANIPLLLVPKEQEAVARKKAKSIDSAVSIIGVSTLAEAIDVINKFKP